MKGVQGVWKWTTSNAPPRMSWSSSRRSSPVAKLISNRVPAKFTIRARPSRRILGASEAPSGASAEDVLGDEDRGAMMVTSCPSSARAAAVSRAWVCTPPERSMS